MNAQNNSAEVLADMDRLGRALLEAIWEDEQAYNGHRQELLALKRENPTEFTQKMRDLLGITDSLSMVDKIIDIMDAGAKREKAMENYLQARQLLTKAGVL